MKRNKRRTNGKYLLQLLQKVAYGLCNLCLIYSLQVPEAPSWHLMRYFSQRSELVIDFLHSFAYVHQLLESNMK